MGEEQDRESSRHSSSRREKEDRHRHHHHRDRDSKHRDSRREDKEKDDDRQRHRHHSHRSNHRSREKEDEEDLSERKRRRREEEKNDEGRHRRHRDEAESSRRSRDHDRHTKPVPESKDTEEMKQPASDFIPTSASLDLTTHATSDPDTSEPSTATATALKRDDWMLNDPTTSTTAASDSDSTYFSTLGRARIKPPRPEKPDPEKLQISSRELNTQLFQGKTVDQYSTPNPAEAKPQYGGPGYQWRMMKLKRTLEAAEEEGRKVEEVVRERYGSWEEFEDVLAERKFLDGRGDGKGRESGREEGGGRGTPTLQSVARRSYMLATGSGGSGGEGSGTDSPPTTSRPSSRQGFKRPGESSLPTTPRPPPPPRNIGFETPSSKPTTPSAIPSVFTPVIERPAATEAGVVLDDGSSDPDRPILTADELNKLQAKILKAELMGDDSQLATLKEEYERESARAKAHANAGDKGGAFAASTHTSGRSSTGTGAGVLLEDGTRELQVLPTLDGRGRMYDIGSLTSPSSPPQGMGNRKKLKGRDKFEARDSTTGHIVRYSADDDSLSLSDLVRQEKFSAGPSSFKNPDSELAANIITDAGFSSNLEDQDDEAHRYAKKKMRSDALKRQFAINDFARTKKALDRCRFCWQDEGSRPPKVTVVSSGYRAYLAVPDHEGVVEGEVGENVLIVPMQHHLSLLEAEEETWDEIRNFQKCLIQMAGEKGKKVIFYETVVSLKPQAHSYIEAVILPSAAMDLLPGVFKESLRSVGGEFSTHRKVIEFTPERPFRNALVPNLPYLAVGWDYRWSSGYGHVIENMDVENGGGKGREEDGGDAYDVSEMAAGGGGMGGKFDVNFARDVIRGVLEDLDAEGGDEGGGYVRGFGRSKRRSDEEKRRARERFKKQWDAYDWTKMLQSQ